MIKLLLLLAGRFVRALPFNAGVGFLAFLVVAASAGTTHADRQEVPILLYGPVEQTAQDTLWVSQQAFSSHMQGLADRGFTTISIGEYIDHIENPGNNPLPDDAVILTFTNGYKNVRDTVDPILANHGFEATVFLLPAFIGQDSSWDEGDEGDPIPHLTWNDVRALEDTGRWEIGSHTSTHARLTELSGNERTQEIAGSKLDIESQIDGDVRYFSYPFGAGTNNTDIRNRIQQANYDAALGVQGIGAVSHDDIWALPRLYINRHVTATDSSDAENYLFGPQWMDVEEVETPDFVPHPADTDEDGEIGTIELTSYASAWLRGDHGDTAFLGRAAQIWLNGGFYDYNPEATGASRWTVAD